MQRIAEQCRCVKGPLARAYQIPSCAGWLRQNLGRASEQVASVLLCSLYGLRGGGFVYAANSNYCYSLSNLRVIKLLVWNGLILVLLPFGLIVVHVYIGQMMRTLDPSVRVFELRTNQTTPFPDLLTSPDEFSLCVRYHQAYLSVRTGRVMNRLQFCCERFPLALGF